MATQKLLAAFVRDIPRFLVFAFGTIIIRLTHFSRRLHSEGQSSSVFHPRLYHSPCHEPQGQERHNNPLHPPHCKFPKQ